MLAAINMPRFDSLGAIVGNVVSLAVFVVAVAILIHRRRSGLAVSPWAWPLCILHLSYNGIYVPIGPALVLVSLYASRREQPAPKEPVAGSA